VNIKDYLSLYTVLFTEGGATHDKVLQSKAVPYKRTRTANVETRRQLQVHMELDVGEARGALQTRRETLVGI
jgi:hypothetical protein